MTARPNIDADSWTVAGRTFTSNVINGDFVLTADEVNPVIAALTEHGIEVISIHNHLLDEEPRHGYELGKLGYNVKILEERGKDLVQVAELARRNGDLLSYDRARRLALVHFEGAIGGRAGREQDRRRAVEGTERGPRQPLARRRRCAGRRRRRARCGSWRGAAFR